ncbi:MAG TPA: twin-arginine translocase TatA/TatE family subunit [Vampirovibrionales bacterium]
MLPNLHFGEIIVLCIIGLIVFGPKKLPELGKSVGEALVNFKKSFQQATENKNIENDLSEKPSNLS